MLIETEIATLAKKQVEVYVGDCFRRDILFYFKIISQDYAVKVTSSEFYHNNSIEICRVQHIFNGNPVSITPKLFQEKFNEVSKIFNTLVK